MSGLVEETVEFSEDRTALGEAAANAVAALANGEQEAFEGMNDVTKVRFTGMAFDSIDNVIKLGDELMFLVVARCTAETKETLKDGLTRNIRRMDVSSVVIREDDPA